MNDMGTIIRENKDKPTDTKTERWIKNKMINAIHFK
jgi:hypothetical protein